MTLGKQKAQKRKESSLLVEIRESASKNNGEFPLLSQSAVRRYQTFHRFRFRKQVNHGLKRGKYRGRSSKL